MMMMTMTVMMMMMVVMVTMTMVTMTMVTATMVIMTMTMLRTAVVVVGAGCVGGKGAMDRETKAAESTTRVLLMSQAIRSAQYVPRAPICSEAPLGSR